VHGYGEKADNQSHSKPPKASSAIRATDSSRLHQEHPSARHLWPTTPRKNQVRASAKGQTAIGIDEGQVGYLETAATNVRDHGEV